MIDREELKREAMDLVRDDFKPIYGEYLHEHSERVVATLSNKFIPWLIDKVLDEVGN